MKFSVGKRIMQPSMRGASPKRMSRRPWIIRRYMPQQNLDLTDASPFVFRVTHFEGIPYNNSAQILPGAPFFSGVTLRILALRTSQLGEVSLFFFAAYSPYVVNTMYLTLNVYWDRSPTIQKPNGPTPRTLRATVPKVPTPARSVPESIAPSRRQRNTRPTKCWIDSKFLVRSDV